MFLINIYFKVFRDFPQILKQNIKCFNSSLNYVYCVTTDDKVYGKGPHIDQILGYDDNNLSKNILINELCDKNIEEFYQGWSFMFARSFENQIFSWGINDFGQLGRGCLARFLKPQKIDFFDKKDIIDISCGKNHCLALSSDGVVYGWGDNRGEQIDWNQSSKRFIPAPIKIDLGEKCRFINCSGEISFAVTENGDAYYWGDRYIYGSGLKRLNEPVLIYIPHVKEICEYHSLFIILDQNGKVHVYYPSKRHSNQLFGEPIYTEFTDLYQEGNNCYIQSHNSVYKLDFFKGKPYLCETKYKNFLQICTEEMNYFKKTIYLTKQYDFMGKQIIRQDGKNVVENIMFRSDIEDKVRIYLHQTYYRLKYLISSIEIKGKSGNKFQSTKFEHKINYFIFLKTLKSKIKRIKLNILKSIFNLSSGIGFKIIDIYKNLLKFYSKNCWRYFILEILFLFILYNILILQIFNSITTLAENENGLQNSVTISNSLSDLEINENIYLNFPIENINGRYENDFTHIKMIGEGTFGDVIEVKLKNKEEAFAIKRIKIRNETDFKEIEIISKLDSSFVVKSIDAWFEENDRLEKFIYIQMKLCPMNLREFIEPINQRNNQRYKVFNYFISCELFSQLTECVDYLHSLESPIIHRDLKLANILISKVINGRFLKLCDFGLAKIHDKSYHSRMRGTLEYMAPEVLNSQKYNTKSDIYSLALIATEIFQFDDNIEQIRALKDRLDFNKYLDKYSNSIIELKSRILMDTISNCLVTVDYHLRPDCKQISEKISEFAINKNSVLNDRHFLSIHPFLENQNRILKEIFEYKLEINL